MTARWPCNGDPDRIADSARTRVRSEFWTAAFTRREVDRKRRSRMSFRGLLRPGRKWRELENTPVIPSCVNVHQFWRECSRSAIIRTTRVFPQKTRALALPRPLIRWKILELVSPRQHFPRQVAVRILLHLLNVRDAKDTSENRD
jgi:hypothetical protein